MAFMTKGFLMTSDDPDQEEWARLYTLPSFKLSKDKIRFPNIFYDEEKRNGHIVISIDMIHFYLRMK